MSNQTRASLGRMVWLWWVLASTLGVALGFAIGSAILFPVIAVLTIGISLAIIQSLVLRQHIPNAGWWVLASIVGLALGAIIGITSTDYIINWVVGLIVLGASLGMMQWLFLITKSKRWLGVTSLPIIALLGWFLYEQVPIWATPEPRFIVSSGEQIYSCKVAAQLYEAEPVKDEQTAKVTRSQASTIAAHVVGRHYGIFNLFTPPSGGLVQVTFPDSQRRLA